MYTLITTLAALLIVQAAPNPPSQTAESRSQVRQFSSVEHITTAPHLMASTSVSSASTSPGLPLSLSLFVIPNPGIHVYAPGQRDVVPVSVTLKPTKAFKAERAVYPKAEKFFFAPLKETQRVYSNRFEITQRLTMAKTVEAGTLTIRGTLRYQACDDKVCYTPQSVPVTWTVQVERK
jgi:thiol:disulfide interchange protein DsbD